MCFPRVRKIRHPSLPRPAFHLFVYHKVLHFIWRGRWDFRTVILRETPAEEDRGVNLYTKFCKFTEVFNFIMYNTNREGNQSENFIYVRDVRE